MRNAVRWTAMTLVCLLAAGADAKPNVLFLYADDLRAEALGAYGNRDIRTPHIDALAARGALLDRAYVLGGHHGAICVPSRAMMLTGRSLFRADEAMTGQTTWPRQFAGVGYQTFATGKWHNGRQSFAAAFDAGSALFFGGMTDPVGATVTAYANGKFGPQQKEERHFTEAIVEEAAGFLKAADPGKPFVCYVAFTAPHDPRQAPDWYHTDSNARPMVVPPNFLPQHPFDNGELKVRDELLAGFPRDPEEVRGHWRDYRAMIEHLDDQVGRLLAALETTGRAKQTIVVFAGDNGLGLGSHGLMGKQNLYEHSARVPVLLAGPGVPRGLRTSTLASLHDLYPTLCDLVGLPTPTGVEGRNLGPTLRGRPGGRDAVFLAYRDVQRALVETRWKMIVYPKAGVEQLYDLQTDPFELRDLAPDPKHAPTLERMRQTMRRRATECGDPWGGSVTL